MKTFSYPISLDKGLRPRLNAAKNSGYLVKADGVKPVNGMLVRQKTVNKLTSDSEMASKGIVVSFPFPQLFQLQDSILMAEEDALWLVNPSGGNLTAISLFSDFAYSQAETIVAAGGVWHVADMKDVVMLFNEKNNIILGPTNNFIDTTPAFNSGCFFKDSRMIFGGMNPAYDNPVWGMKDWNWVCWSAIGGADVLWHYDAAQKDTEQESFEQWKNTMGCYKMPFSGKVLAVKQLGNEYVVVYGENGIAVMQEFAEPVPTFGVMKLKDFGIPQRGAVGGGIFAHVFVSESGQLWKLNADLSSEMLDYAEFVAIGKADCVTSYDDHDDEYYISSDIAGTYVLTSEGLGKHWQNFGSLFRWYTALYAHSEQQIIGDKVFDITTDSIDMGTREIKTIDSIEVTGDGLSELLAGANPWFGGDTGHRELAGVIANDESVSVIRLSGVEFEVHITGVFNPNIGIGTEPHATRMLVWWQRHDKRRTRGQRP